MSSSEPCVLMEVADGVATLTLSRPAALNAINSQMIAELDAAISAVEADASVRVVILTGAGKAFAAGADIAEMKDYGEEEAWAFASRGQRVFARFEKLGVPVLAAINGFALGGGCELAMACDILYSSERAKFGQPEVKLGVTPGFGGTQRLPRRVGPQAAMELLFTGRIIDAAEAYRLGLVARVFPGESLLAEVQAVAKEIAARGPLAVAWAKEVVRAGAHLPLDHANRLEAETFGRCFGTQDQKEGMSAFLGKREPSFQGM